ncbi:putative DNA polymerase, partial [Golovinomyces cichoracearum]
FKATTHFSIIFKIKFDNGDYRSCSTVQIGSTDSEEFQKLCVALGHLFKYEVKSKIISQEYNSDFFSAISGLPKGNVLFMFKPMKNVSETKYDNNNVDKVEKERKLIETHTKDVLLNFKLDGYRLPSTMNLKE